MKTDISLRHCYLSPLDEKLLLRRIRRLERRLVHFAPDAAHLSVAVERQGRSRELHSEIRLVVMGHVIPAGRNSADRMRTLLKRAFADIERGLEGYVAGLRGERTPAAPTV